MNQYRCETCKTPCPYNFDKSDDDRDFTFDERIRYGNIRLHTRKRGCVSHSNFQSERKKMLSKFDEALLCAGIDGWHIDPLGQTIIEYPKGQWGIADTLEHNLLAIIKLLKLEDDENG